MSALEIDGDKALFEGKLQGLVVACYEDERPLQGLLGILDCRFHGTISRCLKAGAITGRKGECTYFPVTRRGKTYHLILAGAGHLKPGHKRAEIPAETFEVLRKNLVGLRLKEIGISKSDFGGVDEDYLSRKMKGIELWIVP
jgi:hypothetical protein